MKTKKIKVMEDEKCSVQMEIRQCLMKIAGILIIGFILGKVVFGVYQCQDDQMSPAICEGDLVFYYRLQQEYRSSDNIVIEKNGKMQIRRIIALAGDVVDITEDGLKINGYLQMEKNIYTETYPYQEGIKFPITLKQDEYFVLGDHRNIAEDSRIYGCVKKAEIKGAAIAFVRHRGL